MDLLENYGKGAIREKKDITRMSIKRHLQKFGAPSLPSVYSLKNLYSQFPVENQGNSSSCAGQAFGGYAQVKTLKRDNVVLRISKKDIYQNVFEPGGGATARKTASYLESSGVCLESDIPSYSPDGTPPTEQFMENIVPRNQGAANFGMAHLFQNIITFNGRDINEVKQAIFNGDGAICAVWGNNVCWTAQNGIVEIPGVPPSDPSLWGHFLILLGWDDSKQLVEAKSSWGDKIGDGGYFYIPYNYFTQGYVQSEYTGVEVPAGYSPTIKDKIINTIQQIITLLKEQMQMIPLTSKL
jgi:C1A family cysteine protease